MGNNMSNQHPQSSPSGNVNSTHLRKEDTDSTDNLLLKEWRHSQDANHDSDANKLSLQNPAPDNNPTQVNRPTNRKDTPAYQWRDGTAEGNYAMRQRLSKGSLVLDKHDLRRSQFAPEKAFYGRSSLQSPITHKINGPYRVSSPIKVNSPMKRQQLRRPLDDDTHHPQSNHSSQSNSPIVRYQNNSNTSNGALQQQSIPVISLPGSSAN